MSRDSSGESLEAILASIRRSLAEQTTSVLEEEAVIPAELLPPAEGIADLDVPPFPASLSQRLAVVPDAGQGAPIGLSEEPAPIAEGPLAAGDAAAAAVPEAGNLSLTPGPTLVPPPAAAPGPEGGSDPGVASAPNGDTAPGAAPEQSVAPAAAVAAARTVAPADAPSVGAAERAPEPKDPLWFLSQESWPQAARPTADTAPPQNALLNGGHAAPASDPRPSRLGAVRGPLPPFFGSSAEVVKETAPEPSVLSATEAQPLTPSLHPAPPSPPPVQSLDGVRAVNGEARSLDTAPRPTDGAGTARASSIFAPPPVHAGGGGEAAPPQIQALDAMVAELLRPMLRRWLDENMPRLVSAALKAEAELMSRRDSGRDPKKP